MPIFLIKDSDATHPDPEKDLRACYKRGDIIEVFDDSRYGRHGNCAQCGQIDTAPIHLDPLVAGFHAYVATWVVDQAFIDANPIAPPFYIIKVTGVSLAQVLKFMNADTLTESRNVGDGVTRQVAVVVRRRLHNVLVNDLPTQIRNALTTNRFVEVTATQVRNYVQNKRTGGTGLD